MPTEGPSPVVQRKIDPDRTDKIDGLPPFALMEKADPDRTDRFVKVPSDDEDTLRQHSSKYLGEGSQNPGATPEVPNKDPSSLFQDVQFGEKGVSPRVLIIVSMTTLVIGIVAGVLLYAPFFGDQGEVSQSPHTSVTKNTRSEHQNQPDTQELEKTQQSENTQEPEKEKRFQKTDQSDQQQMAEKAQKIGIAKSPNMARNRIPDSMWLPMGFRPGQSRPSYVNREVFEQISGSMSDFQSIRVELIGYATAEELETPVRARDIAEKRAIEAVEILRSFGPSRRRFAIRSTDEPCEAQIDEIPEGLVAAVKLRVTKR